ncbi:MAG TPA: HIRAN domain-containing protein [Burkholderiales bacterium]|nr:HIRAN domain-containing protein [Burkholderiales bacterium]
MAWHSEVLRRMALSALLAWIPAALAQDRGSSEIVVQVSLTAGLRYHEAKAVWEQMRVGDALTLVREPANAYDISAVRVDWNGHALGYIPRAENEAVARQMDRGNKLEARITKLTRYRNHRRKLEVEVFLPLTAR